MRHILAAFGVLTALTCATALAATGNEETNQPPGPAQGLPIPPPQPAQPGVGQQDRSVPEQEHSPVPETGVIRPPTQVDPGINRTPPGILHKDFTTPVLPPPGTPGGNPNVQPR
jgi:hypothetical protein